jgi:hypothetical protein
MPFNDLTPPGLEGQGYAAGNTSAFQAPTPAPQPSFLDRIVNYFKPEPMAHPLSRVEDMEKELNALQYRSTRPNG